MEHRTLVVDKTARRAWRSEEPRGENVNGQGQHSNMAEMWREKGKR